MAVVTPAGNPGISTSQDLVGAAIGSVLKEIADLGNKDDKTTGQPVTIPEIDLSFPPLFRRDTNRKGGIFVTLRFRIPPGTALLRVLFVRTADRTSEPAFRQGKFGYDIADITTDEQVAGLVQREIGVRLEYNTQYDVFRLVAFSDTDKSDAAPPQNPIVSPVFNTVPMLQFTTPPEFGNTPSAPDKGCIIRNSLDSVTDAFDAYISIRIFAPYQSGNPLSIASCSVTLGGNTITGTGFLGVVAVGDHITINGWTRKVIAVTNILITVQAETTWPANFTGAMFYGAAHTWETAEALRVGSKYRLSDGTGKAKAGNHWITSDEQTQTYVDFDIADFKAARAYNWLRNFIVHATEARSEATPATTVTFVAGNFTTDTAGLPELTSPTWIYDNQPPYSDVLRNVEFFVNQPGPPIGLDRYLVQRRISGTGTIAYTAGVTTITGTGTLFTKEARKNNWIIVGSERLIVSATPGADGSLTVETAPTTSGAGVAYKIGKNILDRFMRRGKFHPQAGGQIKVNVGERKTKKLASQDFAVILYSVSGNSREFIDNFTTGATDDVGTPGPLANTVTLATNSVDGDPETALAHIGLTMSVADSGTGGTFTSNNISLIEIVMVRRNEANSADVGQPFSELKVLSATELATGAATHEFYKKQGKRFRVTKIIGRNGHQRNEIAVTLDFIAGGLTGIDPADAALVPQPTIPSVVRSDTDDNKADDVMVVWAQNTTAPMLMKEIFFEKNINSSGYRDHKTIPLKTQDYLYLLTTQTGGINSVVTTINVASTAGYPTVGAFVIDSEIITYTGVTPTSFTGCTRGAAGTVATTHLNLAPIYGAYVVTHTVPRRAGKTAQYRLTAVAVYGKRSVAPITTLNGAISAAVTTILGASTTSFPTAGAIVIDSERITYTGIAGNNFTGCTRGTGGTSAASHLNAATVFDSSVSPLQGVTTGDVIQDTAQPTLGAPTLNYVPREGVVVDAMTIPGNWNVPVSKDISFHNNAGTFFILSVYLSTNGSTVGGTGTELTGRYTFGPGKNRLVLPVKLKHLISVLGNNLYVRFSATNSFGRQATPVDVGPFDLTTAKDIFRDGDGIAALDPRATLHSPDNILKNSEFRRKDSTAAGNKQLRYWQVWNNAAGYPIPANSQPVDDTTNTWRWDRQNHAVWHVNGGTRRLVYNLGTRLLPGEVFAITTFVRTTGSGNFRLDFQILDGAAGSLTDNTESTTYVGGQLGTTYALFQTVIKVKDSPSFITGTYADQYLVMNMGTDLTGGSIYLDNIMMPRGTQMLMHANQPGELDGLGGEDVFTDVVPVYIRFKDIENYISAGYGGDYVAQGAYTGAEITLP